MTVEKIRAAMMRDTKRFHPNPLGSGFLTRDERWQGVLRHAKKIGTCDPCGRRAPVTFSTSYATGDTYACAACSN